MKKELNVHFSGNLVDNSVVSFFKTNGYNLNIVELSEKNINNPGQTFLNTLKTIDLIILTGGEDVNPLYYGDVVGKFTHINEKRDILEFNLLHPKRIPSSIIRRIPKLGICRGAQLLTVYNGGRLIQHVEGHKNNDQLIEISKNGFIIKVSSDHHQMMFPFNLNEEHYELIGYSKNFQSSTYLNGDNQEIELPKNFLEPEIVYYPAKNSLCIQSHPEWCIGSEGSNYCLKLIENYLLNNRKKEETFELPEGMQQFPNGWTVTNSFGEMLIFNGESFISSEEYYTKKQTLHNPFLTDNFSAKIINLPKKQKLKRGGVLLTKEEKERREKEKASDNEIFNKIFKIEDIPQLSEEDLEKNESEW